MTGDGPRCADCGGPGGAEWCAALFGELLTLDYSRREPWGALHAVSVACYHFQHPSRAIGGSGPFYWSLLHLYLREGRDSLIAATQRARRNNTHRTGGRKPGPGDFPGAPPFPARAVPPAAFTTTIADVAAGGDFPAEGFEDRVRSWATATVSAWAAPGS
ncbi:hypothetical protein DP939_26220 [Spongiactinospora rosea]|uniref:Uncharacterized protein n=1 Tax=Spongiactinospora rosea TaxID=2248750 RepID=A0A366LUX8_9ACTN|nr:DUF5946 family protein [Spongiactinospora rosea]RBQ16992.1 hypothetical protein DP939_26220 [Spongiactinospora rosea]